MDRLSTAVMVCSDLAKASSLLPSIKHDMVVTSPEIYHLRFAKSEDVITCLSSNIKSKPVTHESYINNLAFTEVEYLTRHAFSNKVCDLKPILKEKNLGTQIKTKIEQKFYCVIETINNDDEILSARAYDFESDLVVMNFDVPFNYFDDDDRNKFQENSIFYWTIGIKEITEHFERKNTFTKKDGKIQSRKNIEHFSEFKMRRVYHPAKFFKEISDEALLRMTSVFKITEEQIALRMNTAKTE